MSQPDKAAFWHGATQDLRAKWSALQTRERQLLGTALLLLALLAVWSVLVSPALKALAQASQRQAALDQQWQRMQTLAAQAKALKNQAAAPVSDSREALKQSLAQWLGGSAQMTIAADRATVTLQSAPPEAVAQWLLQSRQTARAQVVSAQLSRNAAGQWDGSVVLTWPAP